MIDEERKLDLIFYTRKKIGFTPLEKKYLYHPLIVTSWSNTGLVTFIDRKGIHQKTNAKRCSLMQEIEPLKIFLSGKAIFSWKQLQSWSEWREAQILPVKNKIDALYRNHTKLKKKLEKADNEQFSGPKRVPRLSKRKKKKRTGKPKAYMWGGKHQTFVSGAPYKGKYK